MKQLVELLKKKQLTISSCESFTVGYFGSSIGSVSGASQVYQGSLICYNTLIKINVLHVNQETVNKYGVISKQVAYEMCENGANLFKSDLCISFTGNAGPDVMENKPVGLVYMGINYKGTIEVYEKIFKGNRLEVIYQAIEFIKEKIIFELSKPTC